MFETKKDFNFTHHLKFKYKILKNMGRSKTYSLYSINKQAMCDCHGNSLK